MPHESLFALSQDSFHTNPSTTPTHSHAHLSIPIDSLLGLFMERSHDLPLYSAHRGCEAHGTHLRGVPEVCSPAG